MTKKAVISLSGGMDSSTVLALVKSKGYQVICVGFAYGSKHNKYEIAAAERVADFYHADYRLIDIEGVFRHFKSNLLLNGGDIPEGHYEAESMKQTVVPGRNMIFTSILAGVAESEGASKVYLGVHAGDHAIYPDCRPEFVGYLNNAVRFSSGGKVGVSAPYLDGYKKDILRDGNRLRVPYHLTRTCYKQQPIACGKCGSCVERREAFMSIGMKDPIEYEYDGPLPGRAVVARNG